MSSKRSAVFECELCGTTYKTKRWYDNHLASHVTIDVTADASTSNAPVCTEAADNDTAIAEDWGEWSEEDEEVPTYLLLEDEETQDEVIVEETGNPKTKKKKTPALVKCHDCNSSFTTLEGYVKHRMGHGMHAALLRVPNVEEILQECPRLARAVSKDMQTTGLTQGLAPQIASLASDLEKECDSEVMSQFFRTICEGLYSFTQKKHDFLFPSAFASAFYGNSSAFIVDENARTYLSGLLASYIQTTHEVTNILLSAFLMKFANKLLAHILHIIGRSEGTEYVSLESRYATTKQSIQSLDFKENMHYIGGSNVKSVLRTALRVKHPSDEWKKVISTIRDHFLISELAEAADATLMAWTQSLDRGKLIKISGKALEFFVELGREVKPLERLDGSLYTDEVIDKVINSPSILLRWDELKGSLSEEASFKLLHAITSHFYVTWRNGIIGRRQDEMAVAKDARKHGTGGLAFRATLGSKKCKCKCNS